jgi:hypothetical protein
LRLGTILRETGRRSAGGIEKARSLADSLLFTYQLIELDIAEKDFDARIAGSRPTFRRPRMRRACISFRADFGATRLGSG